ncbi:MAG: hypothetical protein ABJL98_02840 [Lentilitoribacter sp.]
MSMLWDELTGDVINHKIAGGMLSFKRLTFRPGLVARDGNENITGYPYGSAFNVVG